MLLRHAVAPCVTIKGRTAEPVLNFLRPSGSNARFHLPSTDAERSELPESFEASMQEGVLFGISARSPFHLDKARVGVAPLILMIDLID